MKKRILSILMVVCMVVTLMSPTALAEASAQAQWGLAGVDGSLPSSWTSGTLAEAMTYANGLSEGTAYIQLLGDVNNANHPIWPLSFSSGKTTILDLNGKNIDRGLTAAIIYGHVIAVGGNLTLKDSSSSANGKVTGGNTNSTYYSCGGVYVNGNGKFTMLSGNITGNKGQTGGGVFVESNGNFDMQGGNITGNLASAGGGVFINNLGIFTMKGGNITGNSANNGGGVYIGWSSPNSGMFNMQGGSIADNAAKNGGGVYNGGDFTIIGGSIIRNKSEMHTRGGDGGGIYTQGVLKSGGTAVIKENYYMSEGSSFERNLTLYKSISIVEPFNSGAAIGVTALNTMNNGFLMAETNFPWGFTNESLIDYSSFFFSDNPRYGIIYGTDNKLQIVNHKATVSANTLTPIAGEDNKITLTVKDYLGNIATNFDGDKNVAIVGVEAAPNGTYGSFNGTALTSDSAGAGQTISVTFTDGVATPNMKLSKADAQTIGFGIAGVTTPATNSLTITPTHGTAASIAVSQDITAPASNGGNFAQQPMVTLKDAYGNICMGDNTIVVTAAKEDAGTWTLTGTTTATASNGVVTFTNLGATNTTLVYKAQLGFTATGIAKVTSTAVTLPAPEVSSSGSGSANTSPVNTIIVIVNGIQQNAGTETISAEKGQSIVTVAVKSNIIESKIDEAVKNNTAKDDNAIQVPVTDKKSEVAKVELTGDIVKKLEKNNFDVSMKWDTVEYVIPAVEFTISKAAENLGVKETDLRAIKVEVKITKSDDKAIEQYNQMAKANGSELVFPPVSFEVVATTTRTDGSTGKVVMSKFSNYVERVMEIPTDVDRSKITTGVVFNQDGSYSHVPTQVFQKDGKWYAKINSLTNSTYSVIWNPITVKSVEKHWSREVVNDMASRLVVFNPETFAPNKAITRADFAEYIIRALGLYREGSKNENKFKDVSTDGDRALAILIANEYGIVSGYQDGTFRPDAWISREEAMTMYQRAMKVTNLLGTDTDRYKAYMDYNQVAGWAKPYVKDVLSAHVFNGKTATTISPKSNLTYGEAAQAIKNLLVESKLINK